MITARNYESERLHAVQRFLQYDFDLNENMQGLLKLAAELFETPAAFLTLMGENEQWFKVTRGFDVHTMPRLGSFCTEAIKNYDVMMVPDALTDARFANNPLVKNIPNIRFYAGSPLSTREGYNIGTICVMDNRCKEVSDDKKQLLSVLAKQAIHLMDLEITYRLLNEKMQMVERQNKALRDIAHIQSHEFRGPLSTIMGLMNEIKDEGYSSPKENLVLMEHVIARLDEQIRVVVKSTEVARSIYTA